MIDQFYTSVELQRFTKATDVWWTYK